MNTRRRKLFHCLLGTGMLLILLLFAISTTTQDKIPAVSFSTESGFYEEEFYLEIQSGMSGTIYYTLDASDPDETSFVYSEPILIGDASENENVYSSITDVTYEFHPVLQELGLVGEEYEIPDFLVDKANIVRAVCIDEDGARSEVYTGVYFVGFDEKTGYDGMSIVSIVTDPENLFDYEKGIYVTGKIFDDYIAGLDELKGVDFVWADANYRQHGQEWKREANVTVWNPDRECVADGAFDICIMGNGSRAWLPRSLNIYARDAYDNSYINGLDMGLSYNANSIQLFGGSNNKTTKIRDWLVQGLVSDLDVLSLASTPCVMFLDGEYWGCYFISERLEEEFFWAQCDIYGEDIYLIKAGAGQIGNEDAVEAYNSMRNFVISYSMEDEEYYAQACAMIDMESCIDYYATEIYIANTDWPSNNEALWRAKDEKGSGYLDGKWRWAFYDLNCAAPKDCATLDCVSRTVQYDDFFASLYENEEFAQKLEERLVYLAENNFYPDKVNRKIDEYEQLMADPIEKEYERFYGDNITIDEFYNVCEEVRDFFELRYQYIMETYGNWT